MNPNDGFRELDREECLRLLSRVPIGRVVHTRHALPAVQPINFSLDADSAVVMRTSADSELAAAIDGEVIAFEADEVDAAAHSGWSVVVTGRAAMVTDPVEHGLAHPYRPALLGGLARGGFHPGRARAGDRSSAGRGRSVYGLGLSSS
ncbi:pyridoxamine 5'-phosphate oxidase family protein [Streptomyces kaempferi]